ncbi:hypothetical protein ATE67_09930 [Sphingopyxis sp. H050]|nr:hypothetical protein ATE67_09930 [Sphingopyxis sp. H050]
MVIATFVSVPISDDLQGCPLSGVRDLCDALPVERTSVFEGIGCPQTVRFGVIESAGVVFVERQAKQMKGVKTSRRRSRPTFPSSKSSVEAALPQQRRVAQQRSEVFLLYTSAGAGAPRMKRRKKVVSGSAHLARPIRDHRPIGDTPRYGRRF